jgi:hypothetical protein
MKIDLRIVGNIHFLDSSGKIALGEGTMTVRTTVEEILKGGGKKTISGDGARKS